MFNPVAAVLGLFSAVSRRSGYGGCANCKLTWNLVHGFSIPYQVDAGMFPVCENCFIKLDTAQLTTYIRELVVNWKAFGYQTAEELQEIEDNAILAVRYIKGEIEEPPFPSHDWERSLQLQGSHSK